MFDSLRKFDILKTSTGMLPVNPLADNDKLSETRLECQIIPEVITTDVVRLLPISFIAPISDGKVPSS